ncbi:lysine-specific demethylase 6B-like [Antechinus flavipes]|uniref:lysine-specific demethylase 6B-like n=1 Tax=Antechinus flavipes TaxID=38775 RepID=UPI002235B87F|nr:lysine-specific demethylase 6B-like [Antechinus flavipes]
MRRRRGCGWAEEPLSAGPGLPSSPPFGLPQPPALLTREDPPGLWAVVPPRLSVRAQLLVPTRAGRNRRPAPQAGRRRRSASGREPPLLPQTPGEGGGRQGGSCQDLLGPRRPPIQRASMRSAGDEAGEAQEPPNLGSVRGPMCSACDSCRAAPPHSRLTGPAVHTSPDDSLAPHPCLPGLRGHDPPAQVCLLPDRSPQLGAAASRGLLQPANSAAISVPA